MKKRILLLAAAITTALSVSAQKLDKMTFTPQWTAQAQFAGYYVAKEMGFYKEAGLDVEIVHPSASQTAMSRLRNDESQATTLQLCEAIERVADGVPLVNILQTSMNNAMVIVSRRGVDPAVQRRARVGVWSAGFAQLAICMNKQNGLGYNWVRFVSNLDLFVVGAIDATVAMSYNEYYQLLQTGFPLSEKVIYRFSEHGYNVQEDGVYMRQDYYQSHKEQSRNFAAASRRGWEWAAEHPDETLDIVMKYVNENHVVTNRVLQKLMLQEVLRLQVDRDSKQRDFRLRPDMVELACRLMKDAGLIQEEVTYEQIIAR